MLVSGLFDPELAPFWAAAWAGASAPLDLAACEGAPLDFAASVASATAPEGEEAPLVRSLQLPIHWRASFLCCSKEAAGGACGHKKSSHQVHHAAHIPSQRHTTPHHVAVPQTFSHAAHHTMSHGKACHSRYTGPCHDASLLVMQGLGSPVCSMSARTAF